MTYCDMFKVLTKFVRTSNNFSLIDPLLQVLVFSTQHIQLQEVVQFFAPVVYHVLQTCVKLV